MRKIDKIYLHWTATSYSWRQPNHYHTVITGDGMTHRLHSYEQDLNTHTWARNRNSIALAVSCMDGTRGTWSVPPTQKQLDAMCKEAAFIALQQNWPADPNVLKYKIMTHAEAAALRDYDINTVRKVSGVSPSDKYDNQARSLGLPHANYGPTSWHDKWPGGDAARWDLWQLKSTDRGGSGGFLLRQKIVEFMHQLSSDKTS